MKNSFETHYSVAMDKIKSPYKSGDYFKFNDSASVFCMNKKTIQDGKGYISCFEVHAISKQRLYPSEGYLFTEAEIANTIRVEGNGGAKL